jgi:hypothetical protein
LKVFGALISAHGLKLSLISIPVDPLLFRNGFSHEFVIDHRVAVDADGAVVLEQIGLAERRLKALTFYDNLVSIFRDFQGFLIL